MKKLFLCITLCAATTLYSCGDNTNSATYYEPQHPELEDAPRYVLDITLTAKPENIESIVLQELVMYPECELWSANGSNLSSVEDTIDIKDYRYMFIEQEGVAILRIFETEQQYLYPYHRGSQIEGGNGGCEKIFSATVQIHSYQNAVTAETFSVSASNFTSVKVPSITALYD